MTNNREKPSYKSIEVSISEKKALRKVILFIRNEDIFPILEEKWLTKILGKESIDPSSNYSSEPTKEDDCPKWIETLLREDTCWDHNELTRDRDYR